MPLDLRQLRYFVAIAEAGSLSAAGATLRVAQSALSRQLQALEHACRGPLFERSARDVLLTEAGRLLLARARFLLAEAGDAIAEVSELNREPGGRVRLVAPPSVADVLYPALAIQVLERLPRIRLELREELTGSALAGLREGSQDLAIVSVPEPDPRIGYETLWRERMMLVGLPGDALIGARRTVPLRLLRELPLILPVGAGWLGLVRRQLGPRAGELQARVQMESPAPMKAIVLAGHGYAVLPFSAVRAELAAGQLAGAALEGFIMPRLLALPLGRPATRAAQAVAEVVRSAAAVILATGAVGWLAPQSAAKPTRRTLNAGATRPAKRSAAFPSGGGSPGGAPG